MCCRRYCSTAAAATTTSVLPPLLPLLTQRQQWQQHGIAVCRPRGADVATKLLILILFLFYFSFCCSMPMGLCCPTSSQLQILAWRPRLLPRLLSFVPSSREWRQSWRQQQGPWRQWMRCILAHPPPCPPPSNPCPREGVGKGNEGEGGGCRCGIGW